MTFGRGWGTLFSSELCGSEAGRPASKQHPRDGARVSNQLVFPSAPAQSMANPLRKSSKPEERVSVKLTMADMHALLMLSRAECTGAEYTYGDAAIDRRVLRKLVEHRLAGLVSRPNTFDRAQITELGRDVLRQIDLVAKRAATATRQGTD